MKYAILYARILADSENVLSVIELVVPLVPVVEPVVPLVLVVEPAPLTEPANALVLETPVLEIPPDDEIPPEVVSPTFTLDSVYPPTEDEFD